MSFRDLSVRSVHQLIHLIEQAVEKSQRIVNGLCRSHIHTGSTQQIDGRFGAAALQEAQIVLHRLRPAAQNFLRQGDGRSIAGGILVHIIVIVEMRNTRPFKADLLIHHNIRPKVIRVELAIDIAQSIGSQALAPLRHLVGLQFKLRKHGLTIQCGAELLKEIVNEVSPLPLIGGVFEQVLHQLFHDNPELFMKIHTSTYETAELIDIFAPAGEMIYSVRLLGVGRLMLSIKADSGRITITNVRNMEKTEWNIEELAESVINIFSMAVDTEDPAKAWTSIYKEEYPKKAEVAPVQQEKPVQRKEKKVQKAKIEKPKPQPVEEQIPGQDNVLNHPEYLPENGNNKADSTENVQETDTFVDKQQEKPPYFEKVSAEKEKTEPEMPTNAINTECENEVDALGNYMDCWEAICDAHRKIALFIEDYSTSDITPDNMRIEAARINAVTLAEELEHLKAL